MGAYITFGCSAHSACMIWLLGPLDSCGTYIKDNMKLCGAYCQTASLRQRTSVAKPERWSYILRDREGHGARSGPENRGATRSRATLPHSAPAPIRNRKRPVADSGAVGNTMGRRVGTSPLARTYAERQARARGSERSVRVRGAVRHRPRARFRNGRRRHCPRATRLGVTIIKS
jgi:hypothetical protein